MYKIIFFTYSLFLVLVSACNTSDDIDSFKEEDIRSYNQQIETGRMKQESWTETPISILNKLLPPEYKSESNSYYKIEIQKNSIDSFTVIVTQEGLGDDSVFGEKRIISFVENKGVWIIKRVRVGFKCRNGRGHKNYSGNVCS